MDCEGVPYTRHGNNPDSLRAVAFLQLHVLRVHIAGAHGLIPPDDLAAGHSPYRDARAVKVKLRTVGSWVLPFRIVVRHLPAVVGRNPSADVRITDQWVSRVHCQLYDLDGTLAVRDLGSTHGTFLNGVNVAESVVMPGDTLTLGMTRLKVAYKRRASKREPVTEMRSARG